MRLTHVKQQPLLCKATKECWRQGKRRPLSRICTDRHVNSLGWNLFICSFLNFVGRSMDQWLILSHPVCFTLHSGHFAGVKRKLAGCIFTTERLKHNLFLNVCLCFIIHHCFWVHLALSIQPSPINNHCWSDVTHKLIGLRIPSFLYVTEPTLFRFDRYSLDKHL